MKKEIHVKSYTRRDGTVVKEHIRNIEQTLQPFTVQNRSFEPQKPIQKASADTQKEGSVWQVIAYQIYNLLQYGIKIASLLNLAGYELDPKTTKLYQPQLLSIIKKLKDSNTQTKSRRDKYLQLLSNSSNNTEYMKNLNEYLKLKDYTQKYENKIKRLEYAVENENYSSVLDELNSFQSDFDETIKEVREKDPVKSQFEILKMRQSENPDRINHPVVSERMPFNKRIILNAIINGKNVFSNINNAQNMWKASAYDFRKSKKYFTKNNGYLVKSINDLPTRELQRIVRKKVKEQLGKNDILGVVFKPNSSLSRLIAESNELKKFLNDNIEDLLAGKIINGSTYFNKSKITDKKGKLKNSEDLKYALGHADILYAHINKQGHFRLIIMDTYDFNPNEDFLIQMARDLQTDNILRTYYTLTLVDIDLKMLPIEVISEMFKLKIKNLR